MTKPKDQNERLLRIILISWFLGLFLLIGGVTYATVEISKIKQNYAELANRSPQIVKTVETQLQPIYTTIQGQKGATGANGKDSTSTTTIIQTETAIPGPKGDTGKPGRSGTDGVNGRPIELAFNVETNLWYQRYVGDTSWFPVAILGLN